ncbi:hypothetical protein Scep_031040 [Stephania cephalantha]|uniref:photosystem I n=1 Tax=Stephania cephalantha TaxID=152367 RepID=A0AAP0HFJ9_9MAGN
MKKASVSWFKNAESRLNHHLSGLFGVSSLAWTGHLVHVAIPASRGEYVRWNNFLDVLPHPQGLGPLFTGQWNLYAQNPDSGNHLFGTSQGAGTAILTLLGGFHPQTQSLWLTDIAHHHLAVAFIFLVAGHMYRTNFGIGHSMKDLLEAHIPPGVDWGVDIKHSTRVEAYGSRLVNAVNENSNSLFLTIGPGDFLVHHAIALGLHTTTLILVKGALDARGSKLMPDKKDFGYSFPCDGPGRGGTCDISAWDAFYLAVFWMLNTIGWVTFYWHWKHITLWQGNVSQFNESSTYLMGWLRDYLWLNSSQLINGYNPFGMNSLSVWAWMFLFGHLVWATGFMFLISWRGYWQELIETLAWAHERTPLANLIRWRDKPVALSIVQARLVGLAHFSVGYIFTYAAFLIASTSGKFG